MKFRTLAFFITLCPFIVNASVGNEIESELKALYQKEWGQIKPCRKIQIDQKRICSDKLRNEGNAPFIQTQLNHTNKIAVLVHGLSDSPYYMNGVADTFHEHGYTVIVPLLPGHGLRDADDDMEDSDIAERWQSHVRAIIDIAKQYAEHVVIGGFSTGGALTTQYYLNHSEKIAGLALFSGALALSENAEGMSNIWGIKLLARFLDGDYQSHGPNPYKYPSVASYAGLELMDVITDIREQLNTGKRISVPVFAAHSASDKTTPIDGVRNLLAHSDGSNTLFVIDEEYDACHADVVVNTPMLLQMKLNEENFDLTDKCAMPKVNPIYGTMTMMLSQFIDQTEKTEIE